MRNKVDHCKHDSANNVTQTSVAARSLVILHISIKAPVMEDCVTILQWRFFPRTRMMWLLEGEKMLTISLRDFTQHRSVSDRQSGMQQESYKSTDQIRSRCR